jgi:hypothetical protein
VTTTAALQAALAAGPATIRLCPATTYTGNFTISRNVTVIGAGPESNILTAGGHGRVLTLGRRVSQVELHQVAITGGDAAYGAGILARGALLLRGCRVSGNRASISGGGLYTLASTTLVNTVVTDNTAINGGGISVDSGTLTLLGSSRVEDNTASNPTTGGLGGGIFGMGVTDASATITLRDASLVRRNRAVSTGAIRGGSGGGIHAQNHVTVRLQDDSRIEDNDADTGGGIDLWGSPGGGPVNSLALLELRQRSAVTGNRATNVGGGIHAIGRSTVQIRDQAQVTANTPDNCEPTVPTSTSTCQ